MADPPGGTTTAQSVAATAVVLRSHASTVARLRNEEDGAADAVRQVRLQTDAYGRLLRGYLPPLLDLQQRTCVQTIRTASDTLHSYTRWLHGTADDVDHGRQVSTQALGEVAGLPVGPVGPAGDGPARPGPVAGGASAPANPLVADRVDSTTWYSGIGTLETLAVLDHAFQSGSWIEGGLGLAGTAIETALWMIDPVGMLVAAGFGVFVEHVKPLKEMLDWLAGDPDQINAHATTWRNIGAAQLAIGSGLLAGVRADLFRWEGVSADTYRHHAQEASGHITALGRACQTTATWVTLSGVLVTVVRTIVRDLIAQAVALLLVRIPLWIAEALVTFGVAIPYVGAQISAFVARVAAQVAKLTRALLTSMRNLMPMVRQVDDIMLMLGRKLLVGQPMMMSIHGGPVGPRRGPVVPLHGGRFDAEIDQIVAYARAHGFPVDEAAVRQVAQDHPREFPALAAQYREMIDDLAARRAAGLLDEGPPGGVHVPDEARARADDLDIRGTPNGRTAMREGSEVLAESLGPAPGPRSNYDAHHIITQNEGGNMMAVLRDKLETAGIGRDTEPNGVWLLRSQDLPNPTAAMPHNTYIHSGYRPDYEYTIFSRLGHLDGQAFLNELAVIKREMAEGAFHLIGRQ